MERAISTMAPPSKAALQEEEALIRAYESELRILQRKRRPVPPEAQENDQGDDDDEDLFLQPTPEMKIAPHSEKKECLELTQSVQGFQFTSVEDTTAHLTLSSNNQQMYVLKGQFVDDPSISATITMVTERQATSQRKRKRDTSSRVVNLEFQLESSTGENIKPVERSAKEHAHKTSLPDWIQRVSAYLQFDQKQKGTLERWKNIFPNCHYSKQEDSLQVLIFPGGLNRRDALPTFSWEWDWKVEGDRVEMREEESFDLSPQGLQDLVSVAGSCEKALETILKAIK